MSGGITPSGTPMITVTLSQLEGVGTDRLQFEKAEDKRLFLDLVNKAYADKAGAAIELEIPRPLNAGELGLVPADRDRYDSILSCAADVLLVLRRLGADMEKSNREAKHVARAGEHELMLKSAQKIREAAVVEMVAGIVAGALQIAGGALAARGSMKAMDVGLKPYNIGGTTAGAPTIGKTATTGTASATSTPGTWQKATNPSIASQSGGPGAPPTSAPPTVQIGSQRAGATATGPQAQSQPGGNAAWKKATPSSDARPDDGPQIAQQRKTAANDKATQESIADRQAIEKANMEAQAIQGKWNAVLQIFMGASSAANSIIGIGAKELEAQKAVIDADTKMMGYKVDDAKESQDTFRQLKEEMQKILGELSQGEYEMNKQIWS